MGTIVLITGVLLMILGFLVKRYPNLIAGYNTMPSYEKERFDIQKYSSIMRIGLITMGILLVLFTLGAQFYNLENFIPIGIFVIILPGTLFLAITGQIYKNRSVRA